MNAILHEDHQKDNDKYLGNKHGICFVLVFCLLKINPICIPQINSFLAFKKKIQKLGPSYLLQFIKKRGCECLAAFT